jgi:pimeloyl-ACP methyl ester carboxylesterase
MIDHRQVHVPGACLQVETQGEGEGEGEAVLLLHGFAGDRRLWDGFGSELAQKRRVIRYDLRGFGESVDLDQRPFRHARDLAALLDALRIDRCALVGVSMGGAIALNFALDHPERVRRLALVSPGIVAWEWSEEWRSAWRPIVDAARAGNLAAARELWWRHPLFDTTRADPQAAAKLRESIDAYSGSHWAHGDNEEPAMPDVDRLGLLTPETLLLTGTADLTDFRLIADLIEAVSPNVRRIEYDGAGHMLHLERPETFAADMRAFLTA